MKARPRFYLAHPFDSRLSRRQWELETEETLGIELVNPFYDLVRDDIDAIDAGKRERYHGDPASIVLRDLEALASCDGVVAFVDGNLSYGTIMEIAYAYTLGVPVYLCCTNGQQDHPWLAYHAENIVLSVEQLEDLLQALVRSAA
ncbi:MAG: nucleoside 2-deoxyribosyltransferase [Planctomycetaceae bacterium]|nr:nucleoside 2-deoxyribosyltransferase [Planctomycetaceae bacterium]